MLRTSLLALALSGLLWSQTPLNLSIQASGQSAVTVAPGTTIAFTVTGELAAPTSLGLAMFSFDLGFSGGTVAPLTAASPAMNPFQRPLGFTNPAGFGGTPYAGGLLQVGGAQNTIVSSFAPYPTGSVLTQVAQAGSPAALAQGSITAPRQVGSYVLSLSNVFANVIRTGETGVPFWKVDPAVPGTITPLTVTVRALRADITAISLANPVVQTLSLDAGAANANRIYWMLGTHTGITPGIPLATGLSIPLNYDVYFQYALDFPNGAILGASLGLLDNQGRATTTVTIPAGLPPEAAGLLLHHAYVLFFPLDFASNAEPLDIVP